MGTEIWNMYCFTKFMEPLPSNLSIPLCQHISLDVFRIFARVHHPSYYSFFFFFCSMQFILSLSLVFCNPLPASLFIYLQWQPFHSEHFHKTKLWQNQAFTVAIWYLVGIMIYSLHFQHYPLGFQQANKIYYLHGEWINIFRMLIS